MIINSSVRLPKIVPSEHNITQPMDFIKKFEHMFATHTEKDACVNAEDNFAVNPFIKICIQNNNAMGTKTS